jgi:hypothetical protein
MKKLISILHWLIPLSLLAFLILAMIWVQDLKVPEVDHEWLSIGLIGIFVFLINFWINKNPSEFLVDNYFLLPEEKHDKEEKNESQY